MDGQQQQGFMDGHWGSLPQPQPQQQQQQQHTPPSSGESAMAYVSLSSEVTSTHEEAQMAGLNSSMEQAKLQSQQIQLLVAQAQASRRVLGGPAVANPSSAAQQAQGLQAALKGLSLGDAQPGAPQGVRSAIISEGPGLGSGMFWGQAQAPASANNAYQLVSQGGGQGSQQAGGHAGVQSEGVVDLRHLAPNLSNSQLAFMSNNRGSPATTTTGAGTHQQHQQQHPQNAADQLLSQLANANQQAERLRALNRANSQLNGQLVGNQLILSNHNQGGMSGLGGSVQLVVDNTDADALALALASTGNLNSLDFGSNQSVSQLLAQDNTASITPTVTNSSSVANSASLYVKNLSPDADELYLYQKFAPHGALLSCKVKTDPATGKCRGVGFVNYVDQASALRAMQQLHGTRTPEGRQLHITLQAPRAVRAAAAAAAAAANVTTATAGGMSLSGATTISPRSETTLVSGHHLDPGSGQFLTINGQTLPLSSQTVSLGGQTVTLGSMGSAGTVTLNSQGMPLNSQGMPLNSQGMTLNGQGMPLGAQTVSLNGPMLVGHHPQLQFSVRPQGM